MSTPIKELSSTLAKSIIKNFIYHDYGEYAGYNENPSLASLYELQGLVQALIAVKLSEAK